jgi:hypothetical protein
VEPVVYIKAGPAGVAGKRGYRAIGLEAIDDVSVLQIEAAGDRASDAKFRNQNA